MRHVAFLRAINTGRRRVSMDQLRQATAAIDGISDVATYIASGNVIFEADPTPELSDRLETALGATLGFDVPVFLRTAQEIRAIAACHPFPNAAADWKLHISFLPATPDGTAVANLLATATDTDRLAVRDREVYWLHPGGVMESAHSEDVVVRILEMATTRRGAPTVRKLAAKFFAE